MAQRVQLEEKDRNLQQKDSLIAAGEQQLRQRGEEIHRHAADSKEEIKLRWREGGRAPVKMFKYCDAVVGGGVVYYNEVPFSSGNNKIHAYHTTTSKWSLIPPCPVHSGFTLAVINGTLTIVGGFGEDGKDTNKLFSLTGAGEDGEKTWSEDFPPMPTKRRNVSALFIGTSLIVAGGDRGDDVVLNMVEILDTSTRQWHTAAELPQPLTSSSMTVCGDRIYLLGGGNDDDEPTRSVYSCSLTTLLMSVGSRALSRSSSKDTWTRVADLPVTMSTAVSLHGQLIAVGGKDSERRPTSAIHRYHPSTNSWEVISHMATPRITCLAAVLPDNQLMVVGGAGSNAKIMDSVEFGSVEI